MNCIMCVDRNWAIGYKNSLLVRIPDDMRMFREKTAGNVVIAGRKTLESFPGGRPLKDRVNIVISTSMSGNSDGAIIVKSPEEAAAEAKKHSGLETYVVGGGAVYRAMLPFCDTAYVTYIDHVYAADTFAPDLDRDPEWQMVSESDEQTYFDLVYTYRVYRRNL